MKDYETARDEQQREKEKDEKEIFQQLIIQSAIFHPIWDQALSTKH